MGSDGVIGAADGILTAFLSKFVGEAWGQDLSGILINLASSGLEAVGISCLGTLNSRHDHDLHKLAAAAMRGACQKSKKLPDLWKDHHAEIIDTIAKAAEERFMDENDELAQTVLRALLTGQTQNVEASIASFVEPHLGDPRPPDWERIRDSIAQEFFQEFQRLYKAKRHESGRQALDREVAWSIAQWVKSNSDELQKQPDQLRQIQAALDGMAKGTVEIPD